MVFIVFNLLIAVLVDNSKVSEEENRGQFSTVWFIQYEEVVDNRLFTAKVSHQKAQTSTALTQLEAMESDDNSEDEAIMDKIKNDESKPTRTRNLDDEEEFVEHFSDVPPSQLLLLQWYYRILPG